MKDLVKSIDKLPMIIKFLGVLFYGILSNIYRLARSFAANNVLGIILSIILLFTGGLLILWVVDLICIVLNKKIIWFC